jgi:hypothetical protein
MFPTPRACTSASRTNPSAPATTSPDLRITPPETDRTAAPASVTAAVPTIQVRENALDHRVLFDRSNDLQIAATHARLNIKVEYTL